LMDQAHRKENHLLFPKLLGWLRGIKNLHQKMKIVAPMRASIPQKS
jgi:hypothetical protein